MQVVAKSIDEIKPYENNPRNNDDAVDAVANSIKEFGWQQPIVVDIGGVIIAGHTRYKAAQKLGLKTVPVVVAKDLTEEQVKAYRLADNKSGELAKWDDKLLEDELVGIDDIDMSQFGFDDDTPLDTVDEPTDEYAESEDDVDEDDYNIEVSEESDVQQGQIYKLGNHYVMCGDSTDPEQVSKLMQGKKSDLVFTDPPYGMKKESDGVANDNLNYDDLLAFNKKWIPISFSNLKANGSWYCFGIDEPLMDIYSNILKPMIKKNQITFRNLITWDKGNGQAQNSDLTRSYAIADEKCLFVMCGVQGFNNNSDHYFDGWDKIRLYLCNEAEKVGLTSKKVQEITGTQMYKHWFTKSQWSFITKEHYKKIQEYYKDSDAFKREYDDLKREYDDLKREYYSTRAYFNNTHDNMNNVWHFKRASGKEKEQTGGHATPKPLKLCARAIESSSRPGETVLDMFGGSGSTLIACEQLGRSAYLMELEPKWVDVIIDRWESFTGEKAELICK